MKTIIECKKDLFNSGQCFTKGKQYVVESEISKSASLMERQVTNDLGEPHTISTWWKHFKIIK